MTFIEFVRKENPEDQTVLCMCTVCNSISFYHSNIYCIECEKAKETDQSNLNKYASSIESKIEKAKKVTDLDYCFSDFGDGFYNSPEEAQEAGETGVFGAKFLPFNLSVENLVNSILDGHHDGADDRSLVGLEELEKAVDVFNELQVKNGSYEVDYSVWQEIPQNETFAMIKPDAVKRSLEGEMISYIESHGFEVVEQEKRFLTRQEAEWLYQEHKNKSHFNDLVEYTISYEAVLLKLRGSMSNTPMAFRDLMGPTDREKAEPHTLRAKYAIGLRENSIHGSDSPSAAIDEICYFFD
jgi:nucleoside-diphosphate kinase